MKNVILLLVDERQNLPGFVLNQAAALGNMAGQERLQEAVLAIQQEHQREWVREKKVLLGYGTMTVAGLLGLIYTMK